MRKARSKLQSRVGPLLVVAVVSPAFAGRKRPALVLYTAGVALLWGLGLLAFWVELPAQKFLMLLAQKFQNHYSCLLTEVAMTFWAR